MIKNFDIDTLEYNLFLEILSASFSSYFAREATYMLYPKTTIDEALALQSEFSSALNLFDSATPPTLNDKDFYIFFKKLKNTPIFQLTIEPQEYIEIKDFLYSISMLKRYLIERVNFIKNLSIYIDDLDPINELVDIINNTFEDDGDIKDTASYTLRQIRLNTKTYKNQIVKTLQKIIGHSGSDRFIQDSVITIRNNRYTIACKNNFSQYISGIVHDRSASGQTLYVEPTSSISLNNALQDLYMEEKSEIVRILSNIYNLFVNNLDNIYRTVSAYTKLSLLLEIGNFYKPHEYTFPEFTDYIYLSSVHHPILAISKTVKSIPIDIKMTSKQKLIVISGPNTGGKTAAIKSIGLNHILAMSGLPIFAKQGKMIFFTNIKADIGDMQSLTMDLSTFSSHMTNIRDIITDIGNNALVIFDELGTGTEPKEGAALAISILEYLKSRGATVALTTHFSDIKTYAITREDSKLYAVDFDYDTFIAKYVLLENVSGNSDPIIIAKRLNFPLEIIENAQNKIRELKNSSEVILEQANIIKAEAEQIKRELIIEREKFDNLQNDFNRKNAELEDKINKKESELLSETYNLLIKTKRMIKDNKKISLESVDKNISEVKDKISLIQSKEEAKPTLNNIELGDTIILDKYSKPAKIIALDSKNVTFDMNGIKLNMKRDKIKGTKVEVNKTSEIKIVNAKTTSSSNIELNIIGKRVEEGIDILDKFIDSSLISGYDKVYIIHGRGSGQLRNAVQAHLKKLSLQFSTADEQEGGSAVTVVVL